MLDFKQVVTNIGLVSVRVVELTAENTDEVIEALRKAGYLVGRSNHDEGAIYFTGPDFAHGSHEPNKTYIGDLIVVDGNKWTPLRYAEFHLSDSTVRDTIMRSYRKPIPSN